MLFPFLSCGTSADEEVDGRALPVYTYSHLLYYQVHECSFTRPQGNRGCHGAWCGTDQPGDSASLDEDIGVILDDMAQPGELPAGQNQAATDLKRNLTGRIVQTIIAALPPRWQQNCPVAWTSPTSTCHRSTSSCRTVASTSQGSPARPCPTSRQSVPADRSRPAKKASCERPALG